jgi:hypothetical protein
MLAPGEPAIIGVWRSASVWTGPSLAPVVFECCRNLGGLPGPTMARGSASRAGLACCGPGRRRSGHSTNPRLTPNDATRPVGCHWCRRTIPGMARLAPVPRLRGREVELRAVGDAFDRVAAGHPATLLVEGEAGIGKTRLLAEALDDAHSRGLEVVTGRAQELERTRPFGVLADTLACTGACTGSSPDPRRRAIAGLLTPRVGDRGPLTVSSDPDLQFQAVDAFGDLIEALALRGPLVLAPTTCSGPTRPAC